MGDFNQNNRQMHKAVCDECGKSCEVPFKPTGDKPIYCNDCFRNKRSDEPRRDSGKFNSGNKSMHKAVCDKCGKDCEVPFKPTGDKPIYCSKCFSKPDRGNGAETSNSQLEIINTKLDKILEVLKPSAPAKEDKKKKTVKKAKVVKKVASTKKPKAKKNK